MCELSKTISSYAESSSEAFALLSDSGNLSYSKLNADATRLANHLRSLGVARGVTVALCECRSFNQIIAALATMRAGGTYVPIDPAWPDERVRHIVSDSAAAVFVTPRVISNRISTYAVPLSLHEDVEVIAAADPIHHETVSSAEDLAYIIYTSGSTGVPKGVEITHGNLLHLIAWHRKEFEITQHDHASHLAGLGFDASVWEVWPYLMAGACVSLADDAVRTSPVLLQQWLVQKKITVGFIPTSLAEPMLRMSWPKEAALRFLLTGGDVLHAVPREGQPFTVVNNYGPTECTVVATSGTVSPHIYGAPTLGKAITGTQVYVLDSQGRVAGVGEKGEIYIGGNGVGRGYRNLPELTAQSFLPDWISGHPGARLYKTGDYATQLPDGQLVFHGRIDGQQKIRGQRLELGEIICALNRHHSIAFNIVCPNESELDEKHLVAYVLPVEGTVPSAKELQHFLAETLPSYMIPAVFVRLETIPLNGNGKVDSALLPLPNADNMLSEAASQVPISRIQEIVLGIVKQLLRVESVGIDDNFFMIGGHSLLGTQLVLRIRESCGVKLTMRDLFDARTVGQISSLIEDLLLRELNLLTDEEAGKQAGG
jgi:amino acid adenylation domain-containing protein